MQITIEPPKNNSQGKLTFKEFQLLYFLCSKKVKGNYNEGYNLYIKLNNMLQDLSGNNILSDEIIKEFEENTL